MDGIKWYAVRLENEDDMFDATEHLSMNGYTFDTNCERIIFISEDEVEWALTYLEENNIEHMVF